MGKETSINMIKADSFFKEAESLWEDAGKELPDSS